MKRISFLFFAMSSALVSAAEISDTYEEKRPKIGVEIGATFSDVNGPADINQQHRTGLAAGVKAEFPLTPYLSIQPEALFVQRGVTLGGRGYNLTAKYNTIEVPVLLKAAPMPGNVSPYLTAGPMVFFNVSRNVTASTPVGTASANFEPRTVEFGLSVGGGVDIGPAFVAANYLIGLTQLNSANSQYQSRGVQLLGGVRM